MRHTAFFITLTALLACWLLPQTAEAGVASLLFTDGETINKLQDVDREGADLGGDMTLDVGDRLFGVYAIDFVEDVDASPPPPFGVDPDTDDVGDTTDNAVELWEWGFSTPSYDDTKTDDVLKEDNLDIDSLTYFWVAHTPTDIFADLGQLDLRYMASLDDLETTASGLPLRDHNWLFSESTKIDELVFANVYTPVHLTGFNDGAPDIPGVPPGNDGKTLPLPTDTDIFIKPTPEPGVLVAWVGLALMGLVAGWRKWRRSM